MTTQACSNTCGQGLKTCEKNKWSDCEVDHQEQTCSSACGSGKLTCDNGTWTSCDAPQPLPPTLHATIRDFRNGQPSDFDRPDIESSVDDRGYVQSVLGSDDTPVYALSGPSITVQSAQTFYEWYHDIAGPPAINMSTSIDLPLVPATDRPGLYVYKNYAFFPIDNQLFGNEGLQHNYSFTLSTSANFTYLGNEIFTFSGDDDVLVFINRHLAIDLGGVHEAESATVDLAEHAQEFEISVGNRYPIHIFYAERHPFRSDFVVETSIADIGACP
jgi:fibro-slime domain-containing protein